MAVDLIFTRAPHAGGPVHLVFGASSAPPVDSTTVTGTSMLGALVGSGAVQIVPHPVAVAGVGIFGGVFGSGVALYDNRNPRRASTVAALPHQPALPLWLATALGWAPSRREIGGTTSGWGVATPVARETSSGWRPSAPRATVSAAPWVQGLAVQAERAAVHQVAASLRAQSAAAWHAAQAEQARSAQAAFVHQRAKSLLWQAAAPWGVAARLQALAVGRHGSGTARAVHFVAVWEAGQPVPPGLELWPRPTPGGPPPRVPSTHLVFACPPGWLGSGPVHLLFGRVCGGPPVGPGAPLYILPARFYMAVHTLTAHHLPDLAPVPIFNVSMSADAGSFAWTFSASGPASLFDQLAPSAGLPAQIRITLDGIPFVFAVDSVQSQEAFGQRGVRISGRSATALLARPYARETARLNTSAATAQQLALDALEFTGAGLDWGLIDWLVPAGAWSHSGTPLAAVQAIVEAAGGYLQSHRTAATLLARHPYPELAGGLPGGPWNWYQPGVLPDVELAPDAIITSGIERRDGPDVNGVYVSGTTQGVLALVRRTGTAADKLASLITDPLITAQEAALQRGLAVLGAGGPKHLVQIELPILTGAGQPGVLDVGQLVQVNATSAWRGRVRSVSVNATMPKARQTVQIERHLETV